MEQPTIVSKVLRGLQEESNFYIGVDDTMSDESEANRAVFWGVNGFISCLLTVVVLWCCFSKKECLTNVDERRRQTDLEYQRTLQEREEKKKKAKIDTPEQRTRKLISSFKKHGVVMTVTEESLVEGEKNVDEENLVEKENPVEAVEDLEDPDASVTSLNAAGQLKLSTGRLVPNCCAICLGSYDPGDTVVWSSNESCQHAFHEDCVVGWLVKFQPETPCPCCRQEFTDLEKLRQERKIKWAGPAFDINAIAL